MVTADRRQLWINGTTKWCDHRLTEEITSEAGAVLAELCRACQMRVAEYGKCTGCGRDRRLVKFVQSKRARYCSEGCQAEHLKKVRADKDAKAQADAAAITKGFPK